MAENRTGHSRHRFAPDFDDWFGRGFPGLPGWRPGSAPHSIPVEVTQQDGVYVLRAELPGMELEDIHVSVDDNLVTVSAEHDETDQDKEHSEFRYGSFRRTVRLPDAVPADRIDATYTDGLLTVRVPMRGREQKPGQIVPVRRGHTEDTRGAK
ncbi:Hsp20/alpha crystallin family protein [Streptomyces sp. SID9727]|uniref:Hsp20/alpha crystallin family protein n=1 Tax=Streptomyces sp. SID9727 TaxID=2706114 RepID=UPI0013CAF924|nr:Hsp20/alpha crystallin family protein [Streptomyces sp. SID9727]NEC67709.1 Hsp20/alpha crystallin family protein [Streptomyces sp. SID9727]